MLSIGYFIFFCIPLSFLSIIVLIFGLKDRTGPPKELIISAILILCSIFGISYFHGKTAIKVYDDTIEYDIVKLNNIVYLYNYKDEQFISLNQKFNRNIDEDKIVIKFFRYSSLPITSNLRIELTDLVEKNNIK